MSSEVLVPGGFGTAFVAKAGQLVVIEDVEGQQVADFVAFAEHNRTEMASRARHNVDSII